MEIWKNIEGYENLYQISTHGNVKSLKFGKERILKPVKDNKNYLQVCLSKQGKQKTHRIHRLVAEAFIPNHNNYEQINHIDEQKTNNASSNLEWCTAAYNINYGTHNQRMAESCTNNPKKSKQVLCVETNKIYPSVNEVHRQTGFSKGNISSACNGKRKTCGSFHWRYVSLKKRVEISLNSLIIKD